MQVMKEREIVSEPKKLPAGCQYCLSTNITVLLLTSLFSWANEMQITCKACGEEYRAIQKK